MSTSVFNYNPPKIPYLEIIYLDEHLMVLIKPSGLLSVPGRLPCHKDSVLKRVQTLFPQAAAVHRLDLDTQGLLLVPLTPGALSALGKQFEQREVHKSYLALVHGELQGSGQIERALRCDLDRRPLQIIDEVHGKPALTFYEGLEYYQNHTLIRLNPYTGRSHQLRVHLASIGHPIVGDRFYGNLKDLSLGYPLALAAVELKFRHPVSGKALSFSYLKGREQVLQSLGRV